MWLTAADAVRELTYPAGALVVLGGPSGAGKSTLAARVLERPPLDPDAVRAGLAAERGVAEAQAPWPQALARFDAELDAALRAGGAVAVATAVRRGHRIGLAKRAAAHGRPLHLVMLDADLELCRAGRAAQGAERIPAGLFEHLVREWAAFRRELAAEGTPHASVTVVDRGAVDVLQRIALLER